MSEPAAATGAAYLFRCLGPVTLSTAAGARVSLRTRKQTALLLYLARQAGRPQGREHLVDLMWSGQDERLARHSLAQVISLTNKALGGEAISFAGKDQIVLEPGRLWLDVDAFEAAAADGHHAVARGLWRGNLLEGLWVQRASQFDRWLESERQRLRHVWRDLLHEAVGGERKSGDWSAMRATAQQLLDADPLDESAMLACVEAIALAGDRTLALRRYDEFASRLRAELDTEPGATLKAWARRFRRGDATPPMPALPSRVAETITLPAAHPLFGREAEFGMLWDGWGAAQASQGSFVILEGAAGIGKSALAVKLATQAHVAGGSVCFARCFRTEKSVPFAPITALLRQLMRLPGFVALGEVWIGELSRLVPELRERYPAAPSPMAIDDSARHRICDATLQAAACVADEQPLLIVVDDIQDADEATLALLHYFGRQTVGQPTLLLCVARRNTAESELERTFFETARSAGIARFLELGALSLEPSTRITRQILAQRGLHAPDWALARLHETRHGNPLLMIEAAMALPARDGRSDEEWVALLRAHLGAEPESFEQTSGERLTALPEQARKVAAVLAAAGRPVSDYELTAVSGLPTTELASAVFALESANFVRRVGGTLGFAHDRYRESAAIHGADKDRKAIHLALAQLLVKSAAENPAARYEVAQHFEAAGRPAEAKEQALQAAKYAGSIGAMRERAEAMQLACSVCSPTVDLLLELARCHLAIKDCEATLAICKQVAQGELPQGAVHLQELLYLRIAAEHHAGRSDLRRTRNDLRALLRSDSPDFEDRPEAYLLLMRSADKAGDHSGARRAARELRKLSRASTRAAASAYHGFCTGYIIGKYYSAEHAIPYFEAALAEACATRTWSLEQVCRDGLGAMFKQLGRNEDSLAQTNFALALARKMLDPLAEAMSLNNIAVTEMTMGRNQAAEQHLRQAIALATTFPTWPYASYPTHNLGALLLDVGREEEAQAFFQTALDHCTQHGLWVIQLMACAGLGVCAARARRFDDLRRWADLLRQWSGGRETHLPDRRLIESALAWDTAVNDRQPETALGRLQRAAADLGTSDVHDSLALQSEGDRLREFLRAEQLG